MEKSIFLDGTEKIITIDGISLNYNSIETSLIIYLPKNLELFNLVDEIKATNNLEINVDGLTITLTEISGILLEINEGTEVKEGNQGEAQIEINGIIQT